MAQDLSSLYPEVWLPDMLPLLFDRLQMARLVDVIPAGPGTNVVGDTVNVHLAGNFTANDKTLTGDVTVQTASVSQVQVVLNTHKEATFMVYDVEQVKTDKDLKRRFLEPAAIAIGNAMEDALLAEYANFTGTVGGAEIGTYGADIGFNTFPAIKRGFREAKTSGQINLVLSAKDEENLLTLDGNGRNMFVGGGEISGGDTHAELVEGRLGRRHGIDTYVSTRVPETSSSPTQTHNIAFTRDTVALIAARLPEAEVDGVRQMTLEHEGYMFRGTMSYDHDKLGHKLTVDALYGAKTVRAELGFEVRS